MRQDEFERLYDAYATGLMGFLVYRTGDPVLAEDLLADTFERVLKARWPLARRNASLKTWLYTIALNLLRDHARRTAAGARALERMTIGEPRLPEHEYDAIEQRGSLQDALATLSEEERVAVALRYGADLTVPEIAELSGEKLTTVEGRVYRAVRKLREELERAEREPRSA